MQHELRHQHYRQTWRHRDTLFDVIVYYVNSNIAEKHFDVIIDFWQHVLRKYYYRQTLWRHHDLISDVMAFYVDINIPKNLFWP